MDHEKEKFLTHLIFSQLLCIWWYCLMFLVSYTKNIKQHHQMHSNWLKIEWVKIFSFCVVSEEAILSAKNSEKYYGSQGSAPNPTGELTALPQTSDVVWDRRS